MRLKNLVAVALRLVLLFGLLNLVLATAYFATTMALSKTQKDLFSLGALILQIVVILGYALAWKYADKISAFVVQGFDEPISLQALTQEQIYICGFILIGLFCTVSQLEQFSRFLFVLLNSPKEALNPLTQMLPAMVEFVAGLWLIFGSRKFYSFLKQFIEPAEPPKP